MTILHRIIWGIVLFSSLSVQAQRMAYYESGKKEVGIEAMAGGGGRIGLTYSVAARAGIRPINGLTTGVYVSHGQFGSSESRQGLPVSAWSGGVYARYYLLQHSRFSVFPQVSIGLANYQYQSETKIGVVVGIGTGMSVLLGKRRRSALQVIVDFKPLGLGQLTGQSVPSSVRFGFSRTF